MEKNFLKLILKIILITLLTLFVGGTISYEFIELMLGDSFHYIIGYILSGQLIIISLIIIFGILILYKFKKYYGK